MARITGLLLRGGRDAGVGIRLRARAEGLMLEETGAVLGVVAEQRGSRRRIAAGRGVVIATGGFGWDAGRLARHVPCRFAAGASGANPIGAGGLGLARRNGGG
jgi:3-oxosteroid 1-dehydrogenase